MHCVVTIDVLVMDQCSSLLFHHWHLFPCDVLGNKSCIHELLPFGCKVGLKLYAMHTCHKRFALKEEK